ncbi:MULTISPECIES: HpcH/HpaI aldolase/citrate lyase family protein [Gordonia]|uniref:HpcH/HpaI aldolase/citrate lyase family protein n=1 Tax=Gordonia TaxID=2053 RepID=UPI0007E9A134|nr:MULTISPECIES: CoA ester lyase [Gordonia]MCM3894666.1 CoA ester lyase [Gordonia sputi]OBA67457.1 aldolase [Gordonia sp. 852002-10350_SCH5691597]
MNVDLLRAARTFLFVPGNRPDRFAKAEAAGADVVVIDLEDAVAPDDKDAARSDVAQWLSSGHAAVVRINGADTQWFDGDIAMLAAVGINNPAGAAEGVGAGAMLAKAEASEIVSRVATASNAPVIPLIETAVGVLNAPGIAATPGVARIAFGAIDFAAELGVDPDDREALLHARSTLVLASAAARVASPVDGVTTALRDAEKLTDDVGYAARIGLRGKLCIHPSQVAAVHDRLAPTDDQLAWARRIVDATRADGSAVAVDGHMVDPPVVARAQQILAAVRS